MRAAGEDGQEERGIIRPRECRCEMRPMAFLEPGAFSARNPWTELRLRDGGVQQ